MARVLRWRSRLGSRRARGGRVSSLRWITLAALLLLLPADGIAQSDEDTTAVPRTPWGQPDLQGIWDFRTLTPMERPPELGGREFFTDEEAAEFEARLLQRWRQGPYRQILPSGRAGWRRRLLEQRSHRDKRSSLIVAPSDGRIPHLDPEGGGDSQSTENDARSPSGSCRSQLVTGPEDLGLFERCILGINAGPPMSPSVYNNNVQVFQTPGYVVLLNEMIHDARVVPLDGRPHLPPTIQPWMGELARPLGREHAGRRHDELHRQEQLQRRFPSVAVGAVGEEGLARPFTWSSASRASGRGHGALRIHRRGSDVVDEPLVSSAADEKDPGATL